MIIANPIYDTVFKRMMENERVVKFFIGTLLDEQIETIDLKPQEFSFIKQLDQDDPEVQTYIREKIRERLSINIFRLDFIATIKTGAGEYKKVLIEIQKAKNQIDLMRFRNYLAEQYKKAEKVNDENVALPITTIYILGFTLPEIDSACIKVERNYKDLVNKKVIDKKSDFVEKLTHDSFIVQVDRITGRYQTSLDKLLSVFEQNHFADEKKITKEFNHPTDLEDVKILTDILHHSGTNPEERKRIETEQEAWRTINAMFEDRERELMLKLNEKDNALTEKEKALTEKDKLIEALKRRLGEA
ncbi:MAG: hypothetical protein MUF24_03505 [Chitinophagaceae bacterium]|jgi:hypothetical protein|nr:hypothetical protein [Chitinophagaceae bacterium]